MTRSRLQRICLLLALSLRLDATALAGDIPLKPVAGVRNINGVAVQLPTLDSSNSRSSMLVIDYSGVQDTAQAVVKALFAPNNDCAGTNIVVTPESSSLMADESGSAMLSLKMSFAVWACIQNSVPDTKVVYELRQLGPFTTKVPVITTSPGLPIRTKLAQGANISCNISFSLVVSPHEITVKAATKDLENNAALASYPSGATGFSQSVVQPIAENFRQLLDPNAVLKTARHDQSPIEFTEASFSLAENKLQAVIKIK